jgi:hypothetical protein
MYSSDAPQRVVTKSLKRTAPPFSILNDTALVNISMVLPIEMENIISGPTFRDFVAIRTEGSMQDITVARLQSTRVQTPLSPLFKSNVPYCMRVSLCTVLRIRYVYPGSCILIFTHPGSPIQIQQQKRRVKKICCHTFLCSHKFHKIEKIISVLKC